MAAKLEKTGTPGVFRRHAKDCLRSRRCDCAYVIVWRDRGRQRTESFRTLAEAREAKRTRESEVAPSEFAPSAKVRLHDYAREWVERYQGTGRRGYREETRDEDRRLLERYALRYFAPQTRLAEIGPKEIADYIGWLVKQPTRRARCSACGKTFSASKDKCPQCHATRRVVVTLSDKSVRNALGPLSACLATARREGLIRHNPATDATLPHRPRVEDDEDRARPFPRVEDENGAAVQLVHPTHRLMFELLAATGMRRSELLALEGRHLALDGDTPHVKVRQRVRRRRGVGLVIGPLKSRYAKRDLPIPRELAERLAALGTAPDGLVFSTAAGTMLDPDNLAERVLATACQEAGVGWAGFHTFRHTLASRLFAQGRNVVQVQRWLGHHSPSFTLDTYVHLLDRDLGEPLDPIPGATEGLPRVNAGSTQRPKTAAKANPVRITKAALQSQ